MKQNNFFLCLFLLMQMLSFGQTFEVGNLKYTVTSGTNVSVSKSDSGCPSGALTIPASISNNGTNYSVTSIGDNAFVYCTSLTSVTIPNSVTSIGDYAFNYCPSLNSLSLGNSVSIIGDYAFSDCNNLASIILPNSLTSIGANAFQSTFGFTSITIPDTVTSIGEYAFIGSSLTSVSLPNSFTIINSGVFNGTSITSISIPNSVVSIGAGAFEGSNLTSVTIPNSVTTIGDFAFASCSNLTTVNIPDSVTSILPAAFIFCYNLTTFTCEIETPLVLGVNEWGEGVFDVVPLPNATLYVPTASVTAYQNASVWQDFGTILPITEVAPTTALENLCNETLPSFNTQLVFTAVAQATEYRFSITDVVTNEEQFVTSNENFFYLTDLENFSFNTLYSVKAQLKIDDVYGAFGSACNVTSPMPVTTQLRPQFCNYTLPTTNANVYASGVLGATAYKFKVAFNGDVQEIERPDSRFSMGFAEGILPSTTYQVSVSVYLGGAWHPYGAVCNLSTPANFPTTQLRAEYCNTTLSNLNENIYADVLVGATGYKFKVVNNGNEQEVEQPTSLFNLSLANNIMPNTTYEISVSMFLGGQWQPYGAVCTVTTPVALPFSQLRAAFCNTTLTSLGQNIYANVVAGALGYKFKVENNGNVQEVERPDSRFDFSMVSDILPNTTYNVSVALFMNNAWQPYGLVCTITTPALPTSQLRPQFCGGSLTSLGSNFYAVFRSGATAYKFKTIINGEEVEVVRPDSRCFMSAFAGATMNQTYTIEVAVQIGGNWSAYGAACNLTVGNVISRTIAEEALANNFEIKAYPNPFGNQITVLLSLKNVTSEITVFDMTGKTIQSFKTSNNEVTVGENLTTGVYLVNITQGHETKNIRVVKQ